MNIKPTQYIFPPRAETCIPNSEAKIYLDIGWKPQIKYNDSRLLIKILPDQKIELWNRHKELLHYKAPETLLAQIRILANRLGLSTTNWHLLDGGLLDQKHEAIKNTIVIWDILVKENEHLLGTTYEQRYSTLLPNSTEPYWYTHPKHKPIDLGIKLEDNIILARQYEATDWDAIWEMVQTANSPYPQPVLEGVVIKDPKGILEMGYKPKNNTSWLSKSRVTTKRHRF